MLDGTLSAPWPAQRRVLFLSLLPNHTAPPSPTPLPRQVNIEVETQTQAIVDTVERVLQKYVAEGRLPALPQQ